MQTGSVPIPYSGSVSADDFKTIRAGTILPSASRAHNGGAASDGVYMTQEYFNPRYSGAQFIIDITDDGAAGTVTAKVQVFDPGQNDWVDLPEATTAALTEGSTVFTVYPGIEEDANTAIAQALPARWRLHITVAANAVVFSVAGFYLP